jgi:hypothetical protein
MPSAPSFHDPENLTDVVFLQGQGLKKLPPFARNEVARCVPRELGGLRGAKVLADVRSHLDDRGSGSPADMLRRSAHFE